MQSLVSWVSENMGMLQKLGGLWLTIGLVSLLLTLFALPIIVIRLQADYFIRDERLTVASISLHPAIAMMGIALKNIFGLLLIVLGAVMLFIPGQGVLTMLFGLMLVNFPGKYKLEQRLVRRPAVLHMLNRVRQKAGREPLIQP